ncbi:MAG: 30S ribosomal protein S6 [Blastocatellia bacterium]|nr:30S ribosomal protein S6 [Blastocatellia bacterium]
MRTYEVPFIVAPTVDEEGVEKLITQFSQVVQDKGGKVVKVDRTSLGRRRLAYPIRKFREGIYVILVIEGSGREIAELERRLRVSSDVVLRFMSIRIDEDLKRAEKLKQKRVSKGLKRPRKEEQGKEAPEEITEEEE